MVDLSFIVVSYNTREMLLRCIDALRKSDGGTSEVWVVDNGSSDGSAQAVAEYPGVHLISNQDNRGFAAACNQGIRESTGRYVLITNSDTFVEPNLAGAITKFMDERPGVGAAGCKLLNMDGTVQASCFRTPSLLQAVLELSGCNARWPNNRFNRAFRILDWGYDTVREVDCVAGACMAVRRETIEQVGMLDERYFLYFEDFDWCRRIRSGGWRILYCPDARAVHIGGVSAAAARREMATAPLEGLRRYMSDVNDGRPVARAMIGFTASAWIAASAVKRALVGRRTRHGRDSA